MKKNMKQETNNNKVYSSKQVIYIFPFILSIPALFCIICIIRFVITINYWILIPFAFFGFFVYISLFLINRGGYKIYYNKEEQALYRKGYFFGFKTKVKVENIKEVWLIDFVREGEFIVLVDTEHKSIDRIRKNSYIAMENTEDNVKFIRQFYDGPINKKNM